MTKVKKVEAQVVEVKEVEAQVSIPYLYEEFMVEMKTKSAAVRRLANENYSRSLIAKFMNMRYQHVRNILVTPLKKVETKIEEEAKVEAEAISE